MLFYVSPLVLGYILPFSTLLHGHIALAFLSLLETDPQILEHWGYADEDQLGKSAQAMDFGLECLRDVQRLREFYTSDRFSVCLSSSVKSMTTSAAPCPGILNPIVVYLMSRIQRVSPFFHNAHSASTYLRHFCHHFF